MSLLTETMNRTNVKKEVDEWGVVDVSDVIARHAFTFVLLQLPAEDVLVEETLQLLVGNVDAQLLKAVVLKVLKAVNVKNADGHVHLPAVHRQNRTISEYLNMSNGPPAY